MNSRVLLENVTKSYPNQDRVAVEKINLEVDQGDFFCLIGPSGGGKTTILKLITGLEKPTSGQIEKPENVSMVFQSGALLPWLTAEDNVALGLTVKGWPKHKVQESVSKYIKMVGLEQFIHKYPRELSGGQRQRVGIARALAVSPEVLVLDEPFSALDPVITKELHQDLLRIWHETKITIIMVSHSLEEAIELADRIAVLSDGHVKGVVNINMPRPRQIRSEGFLEEEEKIANLL